MPGEQAKDERSNIPVYDRFKIETYNYIHDIIANSLNKRFINNSELLKDCICLDPKNFINIKNDIPANSLLEISRLTNIDRNTLAEELQQFAIQFDSITKTFKNTFYTNDFQFSNHENEHDFDEESENKLYNEPSNNCRTCNNCLRCAFNILYEIIHQSGCFNNIYLAYKFILTLPCTQITCERTFSKLKNIKTKLRSTITQDIMESMLLLNIERDIVIDKETVINSIAKSSKELTNLLF